MSCYSLDLRKKVIAHLKKGNSIRKTAKVFGIANATVSSWKKLNKENRLKPKTNSIRKPKKLNQSSLESYVIKHPEKTLEQIASHFKVCINSIFYRIKKANFTYKKKNFSIKKKMKKEEKNISER